MVFLNLDLPISAGSGSYGNMIGYSVKNGDTNNNPSWRTRQIQYKLKDGEASRLFIRDKISEFNKRYWIKTIAD